VRGADSPGWLERLGASSVAGAIRESLWAYPAIEILHILGFIVLVGAAVLFDLRLIGVSRACVRVTDLERHLLPFSRGSLALVVPTGLLLFSTQPVALAASPVFLTKLALILLAGANAWIFHRGVFRGVADWDLARPSPWAARAAGIASMALWAGVVSCGRLLAYL
jgi:hypothetical protein